MVATDNAINPSFRGDRTPACLWCWDHQLTHTGATDCPPAPDHYAATATTN